MAVLIVTDEDDASVLQLPFIRDLNPVKRTFEELRKMGERGTCAEIFSQAFIVAVSGVVTAITPEVVAIISRHLSLGGSLTLYAAAADGSAVKAQAAIKSTFERSALYAGFIDITTRDTGTTAIIQISCSKPAWTAESGVVKPDGSTMLVDEDDLLEGVEPYVPLALGKKDCSSKPRACADCSCGRKELEVELGAEEAKKRLEFGMVRSSCGNCYKGDAFRCAGCPYSGKPAFKPGENVKLDVDMSNQGMAEARTGADEIASVITSRGAVKISL